MQDPIIIVVLGLNALITLAVGIKALTKPSDPSKQYVTRGELQSAVDLLKRDFETKTDRIATEIITRTDKISDYNSRVAHEQNGSLHELSIKVATLLAFHQADKKQPED